MLSKNLIIIRGIPGSGKSTLAYLLDPTGYTICEADQFMIDEFTGEYKFDRTQLSICHSLCKGKVRSFMDDNKVNEQYYQTVIVSNTGTTEKEIQPYIDLANEYGYKVTSLIVENRHGNKSVHNVPSDTIELMKNRFEIKL